MRPVTTFVRALTEAEGQQLRAGLRSADAFTLRRCQILLASAAGQSPALIARNLSCTATAVRNAIHAFAAQGLACLKEKSSRPHSARPLLDRAFDEPLRELLHRSPRAFGKHRSTWTLGLLAQVCCANGWTPRVLSTDAIRLAVQRLGVSWRRAKHWIRSPDPAYARKKSPRPADPPGCASPRLGPGLPGRVLVESPGPAGPARLGGRPAVAPAGVGGAAR